MKTLVTTLLIILTVFGCNNKQKKDVTPAFYHWKTIFSLSQKEKEILHNLSIEKIYTKYFDVVWNSQSNTVEPVAQVIFKDTAYINNKNIRIVPTVFITNESIQKTDSTQINIIAKNITKLIEAITTTYKINTAKEIQIDCDWTATTKQKYFSLLTAIKKQNANFEISSTIRLHQIKFMANTGVPPVKTGMLMCYNMGNLTKIETQNSILDIEELKKYIGNLNNYPLQLDIALPLFEWNILFRKNKFKTIITKLPDSILDKSFTTKISNKYTVNKSCNFNGISFESGDIIRIEKVEIQTIMKAAKIITKNLKQAKLNAALYHLDTLTLNKFTENEIKNIYNAL